MHIHALRAGDGLTVARSLGGVHYHYRQNDETGDDADDGEGPAAPVFSLDLYPSEAQRGVAGRFIAEAREKRRSRAGVQAVEDQWMLESLSLPGGVTMPRLRWARKERQNPDTAAHLAIAFDTFESLVVAYDKEEQRKSGPYHAFGLLAFYERRYSSRPSPVWMSTLPLGTEGEKHPSRRAHTEMLVRLQRAVYSAVGRHLGPGMGSPVLKTEISREKADSLRDLHRLCDWVVTLDRNAGIEYFDSPQEDRDIYDAYVIDCVPEREDLGCLQLITSTANLDEVRNLLDGALDQMGLSRSRRNAEFLLEHLKALSGRFAIRLTGHRPLQISPDNWGTRVFLFGPGLLPDTDFRSEVFPPELVRRYSAPLSTKRRDVPVEISGPQELDHTGGSDGEQDSPTDSDRGEPSICLGTDTLTSAEVAWPLSVKRNPHLLIAGLPGMGKTTCLVNLCRQLVAAGMRPIVFSYHQDIDERLEASLGAVRFLDFDGLGFNPLQVIDRESRMAHLDVAGAMRDIFTAIYRELGDIQADRIRRAIKDSFEEAGWGADTNAPEPAFRRFLEILRDEPRPDRGLLTLLARLGELDDYGFFNTDADSRGSLWESELPTVIRIHTTQNENLQRAFACLVFYGLYKDMFRRGIQERITHALIFDEAHRASRLKLIPTMAKECRKYGISLVLASQEARDFDTSVFSAVANYLVLRSTDTDAKFLVRNVANSRQERTLIDRIKQMDRFRALYFAEGKSRPSQIALSP